MALRDDLFDLIRAMSPSEKRYFKLHADKHTTTDYKSQYEKLFDALNHWPAEEYDEKEFKKKNKGKTYLKNLSTEKIYLYDLILKTLLNYNSRQSPEMKLYEMLIHLRLLINKGLKSQAYRLIDKAEKLATASEQFNEMLSLNDALLMLYRMGPAESLYRAPEIIKKGQQILSQIEITRKAVHLRIQLVEIEAQNSWVASEKLVEKIMQEADELSLQKNLTRRAELSLLNVRQLFLVHHHRFKESLDLTADWLLTIDNNDELVKYTTDQYLFVLANYLLCALRCDELHLIRTGIQKIKEIKTQNASEEADCFRISTQYEFLYMLNTGDFQNASNEMRRIEQGLIKYKHMIAERRMVEFRFNIALLSFLQKEYDQAIIHIGLLNQISGRDDAYVATTSMARVIEWMCLASDGINDILDHSLRSLKKYFRDRGIKNQFIDTLFDCFSLILKEAGLKPASRLSIKKRIESAVAPPEWEQMKALLILWIGEN